MEFTPNQEKENPFDVPFFEDVTAEDGWRGHTTGKSIKGLKSEITRAMGRLNANVTTFQEGVFGKGTEKERHGYVLIYTINTGDGLIRGKMPIAALPCKKNPKSGKGSKTPYRDRVEQSLEMALFMFREYVDGMWFAQKLSPGYLPLIPWMLEEGSGKTFSELFTERNQFALPASAESESEFIDVEFEEK